METNTAKQDRIGARVPRDVYETLCRAAELSGATMQILPLTGNHNRQSFDCGRAELNNWLRQVARQHQDKGLSKTFVAIQDEELTYICGFYALTLAEIDRRFLPDAYQKRLPQRIPGVRLGRFALSEKRLGRITAG